MAEGWLRVRPLGAPDHLMEPGVVGANSVAISDRGMPGPFQPAGRESSGARRPTNPHGVAPKPLPAPPLHNRGEQRLPRPASSRVQMEVDADGLLKLPEDTGAPWDDVATRRTIPTAVKNVDRTDWLNGCLKRGCGDPGGGAAERRRTHPSLAEPYRSQPSLAASLNRTWRGMVGVGWAWQGTGGQGKGMVGARGGRSRGEPTRPTPIPEP